MTRIDWDRFDWSGLTTGWAEDLRVAALFFTRLPLGLPGEVTGESLARALRAAPLIGLASGLLGGGAFALARALGLAPPGSALVALAVIAALTGALHEDGLADFTDGLAGREPSERLAIMRDSRTGVFGTLALIFSLGLRAAAVTEIGRSGEVVAALAAAAAASRGLMPLVTLWLDPARPDGLGAMLGTPRQEAVATAAAIGALAALLLLGPGTGIAALVLGLAALFGVATLARRKLGGYTGDVLGAAQQVVEIAVLLVAAMFA